MPIVSKSSKQPQSPPPPLNIDGDAWVHCAGCMVVGGLVLFIAVMVCMEIHGCTPVVLGEYMRREIEETSLFGIRSTRVVDVPKKDAMYFVLADSDKTCAAGFIHRQEAIDHAFALNRLHKQRPSMFECKWNVKVVSKNELTAKHKSCMDKTKEQIF